ncbi:MAG TPA: metal-dependent hydrolase [Acidimicrobiia bacterium]|jgi:hypothetical protein
MLLWHLGATTAIVRYAFRDERMDLRLLFVGAILPDLVDKPVALIFFDSLRSTRLIAHCLLAATVAMIAVLMATRRGRPRKRWMPLAVGMLVHLFLDGMWSDPETLWWPMLGLDFSPNIAASAGTYLGSLLTNPIVWIEELLGAAYLAWLYVRGGLGGREVRRRFLADGVIAVPIGR